MKNPDRASGWVYYKGEWWEVLKEEGVDGLLLTFQGKNKHVKLKELGDFHGPSKKKRRKASA